MDKQYVINLTNRKGFAPISIYDNSGNPVDAATMSLVTGGQAPVTLSGTMPDGVTPFTIVITEP